MNNNHNDHNYDNNDYHSSLFEYYYYYEDVISTYDCFMIVTMIIMITITIITRVSFLLRRRILDMYQSQINITMTTMMHNNTKQHIQNRLLDKFVDMDCFNLFLGFVGYCYQNNHVCCRNRIGFWYSYKLLADSTEYTITNYLQSEDFLLLCLPIQNGFGITHVVTQGICDE